MQEDSAASKPRVLVVAGDSGLLEQADRALGGSFEVTATSDPDEALKEARTARPAVIVLGYVEPQGTVFKIHRQLREGWLTRGIPVLAVEINPDGPAGGAWRQEEGIPCSEGGYLAVSGGSVIPVTTLKGAGGLAAQVADRVQAQTNAFRRALLDPGTFCITWEQIPGRGALEKQQEDAISNARKAARGGKVHGISVTDNPGGNPAYSTEMLGAEIRNLGIEPLVHIACRDKNRNEIESLLHGLTGSDVRNLLLLTGDYPSDEGYGGTPRPVFDFDAVHALQLVASLNQGLPHQVSKRKDALTATSFFAGACISPFKITEQELMGQYYKLAKKVRAGARFIITQVGYDARKLHEVLQYLKVNGIDIPVMGNIYVLPLGAARAMNSNRIPGCVVVDKLVSELAAEARAEDKGRQARLMRAAKMYAISKGMGCAGAHIAGHNIRYDQVEFIIDEGEKLVDRWMDLVKEFDYPQPNGFYLFERDAATGLNTDKLGPRALKPGSPLNYRFARLAHGLLFNDRSAVFKAMRPVAEFLDSGRRRRKAFGFAEHMAKVALFGCQNCGDCGLTDVAYLCPMSQCPKNQRNAPCGGSYDGWCEVYPGEKRCIWVKAYERLKHYHEEDEIGARIVPPVNWQLWETPSWLNFYLGRDHTAKRLGIKPPQPKADSASKP